MPTKKYNLKNLGRVSPPYGIADVKGATFSFYPYKDREGRTLVSKYEKGTKDSQGNQIDSIKNSTYRYLGRSDIKGIPSLDSVKAGNSFKPDTLFYSDGAKITREIPDIFVDKNNNPITIRVGSTSSIGKKEINKINTYLQENAPVYPLGVLRSWITGYGYPYESMTPSNIVIAKDKIKRYGIPKHELDKNFIGPVISREFKLGGNIRRKAVLGDDDTIKLNPTTVYANGRPIPNLNAYNRVIGYPTLPIINNNVNIPDIPIEVPEFESLNTDVNVPSIALPKISDDIVIPDIPIETPNFKPLNTKVKRVKAIKPTMLENYGLNTGDLVASGIQLAGNIGSSLVNNAMVNRLKFTPMHTMTVAEAPVKFNTTYNINPQLDELRETEEANEREIRDNTASSRNALGRIIGSRLRANRGFNELYGAKLNQESAMLNADAQNRQGVNSRNAQRLQQNISHDTLYNLQGQDAIDNLKSQLKGQIWSNAINQATDSLVGVYNRGQQRISDANSLGYLYASNPDAAKLFMNRNSLIDRIFRYTRKAQGIG